MSTQVIWLVFILSLQSEQVLAENEDLLSSSHKCNYSNLENVARALSNVASSTLITLVTNTFDQISLKFLHRLQFLLGPLQLSEFANISSTLSILVLENGHEILNSTSKTFWAPSNHFIIYLLNPTNEQNEILEYLWNSFKVYNAFLIEDLCSNTVLSYNPAINIVEEIIVDDYSNFKYHLEERLYYWNNTSVIMVFSNEIVSYKADGVRLRNVFDDNFLFTVAGSMGTQPHFIATSDHGRYGVKFDNGSYGGSFNDLMNGKANMTAKGHFIKWYNTDSELVFSHYITLEKVCFTVPREGQIPHLLATLMSLDLYMWIYLFLLYTLAGLSFSVLRKLFLSSYLMQRLKIKLRGVDTVLMMFSYFLGLSFPYNPKLVFEKLILSSILLISFIIVNFFQTTLVTVLTAPVYYKKIETLAELIQSKIEIWSSSEDLISSLQEAGLQEVKFHLKTAQERTEPHRFDVGWIEKLNFLIDIRQLMYTNERSYLVEQCPLFYFTAFMMPRGSALEHRVGHIVSRLSESGLIANWLRMKFDGTDSEIKFKTGKSNILKIKALSLVDFEGCFQLFTWSMLIAFSVFVVEIMYKRARSCICFQKKKVF